MPPRTWIAALQTSQARLRGARLGHRRGERQRLGLGVGGPGRVVGERARLLDVVEHLRAGVRDGLVGADRAVELLALLRVLDRHLHRPLRDARRARRRARRPTDRRPARRRPAAPRRRRRVTRAVARGSRRSARAARARVRRPRRARAPSPSFSDEHGRALGVGDHRSLRRGSKAAAPRASPEAIPGSQRWLLLVGARVLDERGPPRRWRGTGDGRAGVAELLAEDHQLDHAEPLAAVLLGDRDAGPAELADLAPEGVVVGCRTRRARGPSPGVKRAARNSRAVALISRCSSLKSKSIAVSSAT